jgi:hypothetical protein
VLQKTTIPIAHSHETAKNTNLGRNLKNTAEMSVLRILFLHVVMIAIKPLFYSVCQEKKLIFFAVCYPIGARSA